MTTTLSPSPLFRQWDNNGNPLAGGQLFTYAAGTSTPIPTYSDSVGSPNPNPVILNNRGEAQVWLQPNVAYKFTLTDSQGNQIWSVDQIVNSQLITLYGGVDTGSVNAYVINFTSNFTAYTDGVIVYWIPSNANTTASTININGLGVIALVNPDGSALQAGQVVANGVAAVLIKGGQALLIQGGSVLYLSPGAATSPSLSWLANKQSGFYLFDQSSGRIGLTFNGNRGGQIFQGGSAVFTVAGVTGVSSVVAKYTLYADTVTLFIPCFSGTGSGTSFSMSNGANPEIWARRDSGFSGTVLSIPSAQDNGSNLYAQTATVNTIGIIPSAMNMTFYKNGNAAGWVATGSRGLGDSNAVSQLYAIQVSYQITV